MKNKCKQILCAVLAATLIIANAALLGSCTEGGDLTQTSTTTKEQNGTTTTSQSGDGPVQVDPDLMEKDPVLRITEVMANNEIGPAAEDGKRYPWIELEALADLELSQYSLKYAQGEGVALPAASLKAGQLYLLYVGKDGFNMTLDSSAMLTLMHGDKISQSFVYINRGKNCSYLVLEASETTRPTPGYANVLEADRLVINELMCDNSKYPVDGVIGDWVELYNAGGSDIALGSYWISDKLEEPYLSQLPDITLKAGEYTVLRSDHELSFGLGQDGETVYLTRNDGVVSSMVMYSPMEKNYSHTAEGANPIPTPGYENSTEGYYAYVNARKGLIINEVLSSNTKYKKLSGEYHDLVELYNNSDEAINLGDYYLSDKAKSLMSFKLPDVQLKAKGYYLVYCTGKGGEYPDFSISSDGENILLTKADGYVCDSMVVPELMVNVSYGRYNGKLVYFGTPTPGVQNPLGYERISAEPEATVASGSYENSVSVYLVGEGDIYYTTDGTKPTEDSKKYAGEKITFDASGTLRTIAKEGSLITSPEKSFTYFVDTPDYSLPTVMVATSYDTMFGPEGMYTKSTKSIESEARVSFYVDGNEEFAVSCGIKLFGGTSVEYAKKSFQLKFRAKYGTGKLKYKMFENSDVDSFNSLVLRAGGQAQYRSMIADEVGTSLAGLSGNMPTVLVQSYRPANLYINDEYMGVYFIREKINDDFVASHLGGEPEEATIMGFWNGTYVIAGKDGDEWDELYSFVQKKDLSLAENYEYVKSKLDIDSMIDFYVIEMFVANTDTGNVRVAKSRSGDGKWRYVLFDLDLSFIIEKSGANAQLGTLKVTSRPFNPIIYNLLKNDEFTEYFYERLDMHMKSTISPEAVTARIDAIYNEIEKDMQYEIARWKDATDNSGMGRHKTVASWEKKVEELYKKANQEYLDRLLSEVNTAVDKIRK